MIKIDKSCSNKEQMNLSMMKLRCHVHLMIFSTCSAPLSGLGVERPGYIQATDVKPIKFLLNGPMIGVGVNN